MAAPDGIRAIAGRDKRCLFRLSGTFRSCLGVTKPRRRGWCELAETFSDHGRRNIALDDYKRIAGREATDTNPHAESASDDRPKSSIVSMLPN